MCYVKDFVWNKKTYKKIYNIQIKKTNITMNNQKKNSYYVKFMYNNSTIYIHILTPTHTYTHVEDVGYLSFYIQM